MFFQLFRFPNTKPSPTTVRLWGHSVAATSAVVTAPDPSSAFWQAESASAAKAITRLAKKLDVLPLARMVGHRNIKELMTYYNATAAEIAERLD